VRRRLLIAALVVTTLLVVPAVVFHLPVVQRELWDRVTASIDERSGWRIEAERVSLRALPARFVAKGVVIAAEGRTLATLDMLEAKWNWLAVSKAPHRLESLTVDGVHVDLDALPRGSPEESEAMDSPFNLVEIGELRVLRTTGEGSTPAAEIAVDGLNIEGQLMSDLATARVVADQLILVRAGRDLVLGAVRFECRASQRGLEIDLLEISSPSAGASLEGRVVFEPAIDVSIDATVEFDLEAVSRWWDPNLVTGLEPHGRLVFDGNATMTEQEGLDLLFLHRGRPFRFSGYDISEFEVSYSEGQPRVRAADPGWGRATIVMTAPGVADVDAVFDRAPVGRALTFVMPTIAEQVGRPASLTGQIDGTLSYPIVPEMLAGRVDLELQSPLGRFVVDAEGSGMQWRIDDLQVQAMGAELIGNGNIDGSDSVSAHATVSVPSPADTISSLKRRGIIAPGLPIGGGPVVGRVGIGGSTGEPEVDGSINWSSPIFGGQPVEDISAVMIGPLDELQWEIDAALSPSTTLAARGAANILNRTARGDWRFEVAEIEELIDLLQQPLEILIGGRLIASGGFSVLDSGMTVDAEVVGSDLTADAWSIDSVTAQFQATPRSVEVDRLAVQAYSGVVTGGLKIPLTGRDDPVLVRLDWRDIDLAALPAELPDMAAGLLAGNMHLDGSLERPEGELNLAWVADRATGVLDAVMLATRLEGGSLTLASEDLRVADSPAFIDIVAPLGDLRLPEWLWPDAPGGSVRADVRIPGFKSETLVEIFGLETMPATVEADLRAGLAWDPLASEAPVFKMQANNLRLVHGGGELVADGPLEIRFDKNGLEMAPVTLVGLDSRIEASAVLDPTTRMIDGRLRSRLAPEVAAMAPIPVTIDGPVTVDVDVEVPAEATVSLSSVRGTLTLDHRDGRIVMRDPPVEIRGLRIVASIDDGVVNVVEGGAEINRGRVDIGGGWNPDSAQGVVIELDRVTTMVAGILSTWNGDLAIEPREGRLAHISGDLTLAAGLWDERIDLAAAMMGGPSTTSADDEYLHDIGLDLSVGGLAGIRVENNLGRFNVNWDQLQVGGTAGVPILRGEIRIASGGVLSLAGHEVKVRRGVVEFTGNPEIDPLLEIVPESDTTLFGDEEGVDATELATRGLAQGITSALGFENETLRPAEIAVQTETDPSVRFMVGQRLSRQLALFLATNLTDVQDRLTMLQYWNIPGLKGLAFQGYQDTADESVGANVFQRFEWGGSRRLTDRPEIHRLLLDGEWPLSKRRLRRATRLRKGQPYDPFLLFVGAVRMERMLAEHGYQRARVVGGQEGNPMSPTLVFSVDPGESQPVVFEGDSLPGRVRREVTATYRPPPREASSFDDMVDVVRSHIVTEGFVAPDISIDRRNDAVVIEVKKGGHLQLEGPFFDGLPVDAVIPAVRTLGTAEALALTIDRPDWAARVVERIARSAGYLEAEVDDIRKVLSDSGTAEVHITVSAGERARVGTVELVGDDPLGRASGSDFAIRPGMPLDRPAIDAATRKLRRAYVEEGFREASARSTIEPGADGMWRVAVRLSPGRQRTLRAVHFVGRRDVSEKVLLNGLVLEPGDVLLDRDVDLSASQIANFSPIGRDTVEIVPVGSSQADLKFEVEEKKRWTLEVGGGWSSERSFGAAFGARDDNLFGRGIGLNLRGSLDSVERQIFLLGSIPPVPGGRLSFISTIGYKTGDAPDEPDLLSQDQKLASLEASYRLPKSVQVGLYYRWTDTRTYEKVPDDFFPLDLTVTVGTLGARTVIERFDNLFDPRSGWGLTSDLGWSGEPIGSDLEYVSWLSGYSLTLEPMRDTTWMQALRVGVAEPLKGTSLDREARFFAGGQASVRGFDLNTVGPVTFGIDGSLVPAGGGALFILNEELRIPIWDPIRVAVFADIGQVWESWREADFDLSVGVGFGVRWSTPIGPLWADVAWPVANVGISSKKPKFYLGIGRPF
jgi:outer membrane protein assembly factor BamA